MHSVVLPSEGHVFLSHAGIDTEVARQFADALRRNGLDVWFDKDNLQPGDTWMATLERVIQSASAMIVYVGRLGVQAWTDREVRLGLGRNTLDPNGFPLIPVLGEGSDPGSLPPFLQQQQFADLRDRQHAPEEIRRIVEILRKPSTQGAIPPDYWTKCSPFRSLQVFEPEDSWLFFGRDSDTDEMLACIARAPVLAVLGSSGSGKSSLIRAGIIPALRRGRFRCAGSWVDSWRVAVFRPSSAPFDYLAETLPHQLAPELSPKDRLDFIEDCKNKFPRGEEALRNAVTALASPISHGSEKTHILLVADQFEEIFTLNNDSRTRHRYIDSLLAAGQMDSAVPVHLVVAIRADFYPHCLEHSDLSQCLATNLYNVPRMGPSQLREAIDKRLALAAARAEPGLIDSLLADVGEEPGNLALLEHALSQLWEKHGGSGRVLTSGAYSDIGRLRGALGRHADEVYESFRTEAQKGLVQKVFLELVQLGEGSQDTRRRVPKEALLHLGPREEVEQLLARLASSRLISTGGEGPLSSWENFVEVSHEALIREWPTLSEWLAQNREDLRLERSLVRAAEEWLSLKKDPSALQQGPRLAQAEEWFDKHRNASPLLREFLQASRDALGEAARKERAEREREVARQRQLRQEAEARAEAEKQLRQEAERGRLAEKAAAVRVRKFSYTLVVLLVLAAGAAWFAFRQRSFARGLQSMAESRALAAQAEQMLNQNKKAAEDLAVRAWQTAKTTEANRAVAHVFPDLLATLKGHTDDVEHAEFSPDGQRIVTASRDNTARVWNTADGKLLVTLQTHEMGPLYDAEFSPDGGRIVTGGWDAAARVWNSSNGKLVATIEGNGTVIDRVEFSPDGRTIITVPWKGQVLLLWNATNGQLLALLEGHTDKVEYAEFSPDGQRIVTASSDHTAREWSAANGQLLTTLNHDHDVMYASFSPDSQWIVTASCDGARVWKAGSGELLATLARSGSICVDHASFSPDGQRIVTDSDNTAQVWNALNGKLLAVLQGHTETVNHAGFSPDSRWIVTASSDKTTRVWNATNGQLLALLEGHTDKVEYAEFSPDGQRIVTFSKYDQTPRVYRVSGLSRVAELLAK